MSSLTARQFAVKARQYLTEREEAAAGFSVPSLRSMVDDALDDLARSVAATPNLRHLMRTDPASVTITVTSGVADLATLLSTNRVLLDFIQTADIKGANANCYQWVASLSELRLKRKTDRLFTFFTREGTNLYTRDGGAMTDLNESPTVSASCIHTCAQLHVTLEPMLVIAIASRAMRTLSSQQQKIAAAAAGKNAT